MRELLAELMAALDQRLACVYCAVVETRGSTPQKAGAAMLVYPDGTQAGTLGGGCIEAEVKRRALHACNSGGRPEVLSFTLDDDYGWDDGLICGGRMTILAHPVAFTEHSAGVVAYYRRLSELAETGAGFTEAVVIGEVPPHSLGDRHLFDADGTLVARIADNLADGSLAADLVPLATRPRPATRRGIAWLPTLPRVTILLVGGGHVGQAVARLAAEVEFAVWVLDDRSRFASPERFPTANRHLVGDIGTTLRDLVPTLTASTYAVILTRGHNHDEEALYHLAGSACGYVGMIGSKRKIRLIFEDLVARGVSPISLEQVHAPLGYDLGAQTVPEIAISITAELIARRNLGDTTTARQSWLSTGAPT